MRRWILRALSFFRHGRADADLTREIRAHLQLIEDGFVARGMSPEEARYAARRAFGGVEQVKERQRDERSFAWMRGTSLDFRLGLRMLVKYPGLTFVGGVSIALGIAVGAAAFEFLTQAVAPKIPLPGGGRIVALDLWDTEANRGEPRALHDFLAWRGQLTAVEDLGAYRTSERNLGIGDAPGEPVAIAEISASAFRLVRVRPLMGRGLIDADERPGAPGTLVIGYTLWQRRFGSDANVVGRTVRLGHDAAEIVGVMPEGFGFPVAHAAWSPLRIPAPGYAPLGGPPVRMFARLASGAGVARAQSELDAVAARTAAASPKTHQHLRPSVTPYGRARAGIDELGISAAAFNAFVVLFVLLVCADVAALVFARAATRESEILVRNALGASRGRILMQLFVEALVLGGIAAVAGLAVARFGLGWLLAVLEADTGAPLPFWFHADLSWTTILYAALLTVAGAAIAGVIPALKITRGLAARIRQAAAGTSGLRFGGVWTFVIVTQVAVTVTFPACAFFLRGVVVQARDSDPGFPVREMISTRIETEAGTAAQTTLAEIERRVAAEAGVSGVTFTSRLPRTQHRPYSLEIEPPDATAWPVMVPRVGRAFVGPAYFDVLGAPLPAGRAFSAAETAGGARVAIVNRAFVDRALGGANPIGRRVRYVDPADPRPQPWFEIVGVARNLGMAGGDGGDDGAGIYHPAAPGDGDASYLVARVAGDPESFAPRLRAIAAGVDPTLRLYELQRLDKANASSWLESQFLYRVLIVVSAIALMLSLTGVYAITSFTVARRSREIAIRLALGADAPRVITTVCSRAFAQIGIGILLGGVGVLALTRAVTGLAAHEALAVLVYMLVMLAVCLLACVVPTRRGLRIQPVEVLKEI
jgi:predicted permease